VAGDDAARLVDQDRVGPAPLLDAGRNLGNLRFRMGPRVAGVGHQLVERPALYLVGRPRIDIQLNQHLKESTPRSEFRDSVRRGPHRVVGWPGVVVETPRL
jgi:hypothetical protein